MFHARDPGSYGGFTFITPLRKKTATSGLIVQPRNPLYELAKIPVACAKSLETPTQKE